MSPRCTKLRESLKTPGAEEKHTIGNRSPRSAVSCVSWDEPLNLPAEDEPSAAGDLGEGVPGMPPTRSPESLSVVLKLQDDGPHRRLPESTDPREGAWASARVQGNS